MMRPHLADLLRARGSGTKRPASPPTPSLMVDRAAGRPTHRTYDLKAQCPGEYRGGSSTHRHQGTRSGLCELFRSRPTYLTNLAPACARDCDGRTFRPTITTATRRVSTGPLTSVDRRPVISKLRSKAGRECRPFVSSDTKGHRVQALRLSGLPGQRPSPRPFTPREKG